MRPGIIEDSDLWEGSSRHVIMPPGNDLDSGIMPIEAIVDVSPRYGRRFVTKWVPDEEDLLRLRAGEPVFLSLYASQMIPVSVSLSEVPEGFEVCANCGGFLSKVDASRQGRSMEFVHASIGFRACDRPQVHRG